MHNTYQQGNTRENKNNYDKTTWTLILVACVKHSDSDTDPFDHVVEFFSDYSITTLLSGEVLSYHACNFLL